MDDSSQATTAAATTGCVEAGQLPTRIDDASGLAPDDAGGTDLVPVDWDAVQRDYEDCEDKLDVVARRYGITRDALRWRARTGAWLPRNRRRDRSGQALLARVFRLLERQIFHMEGQVGPMNDKDVAALAKVAATLERLMAIERLENKPAQTKRPSKELQLLRQKIADRFAELSEE